MILLNVLGGVHPRLILLAYAGIASTGFLVLAIAIWVSSGAADGRRATSISILVIFAWLIIPFVVGVTPVSYDSRSATLELHPDLERVVPGHQPLEPASSVLGLRDHISSPILPELDDRPPASCRLGVDSRRDCTTSTGVSSQCGEATDTAYCTGLISRPGDSGLGRPWATTRCSGESATPHAGGLIGQLVWPVHSAAAMSAPLAYFTYFFARRAFVELWHHGYFARDRIRRKARAQRHPPVFFDESGSGVPIDAARTDFNIFLRFVTCAILFMMALVSSGIAVEVLAAERAKDTWDGLIATPFRHAKSCWVSCAGRCGASVESG